MSSVNGGLNASNGMSCTKETVLTSLTSGGTANITVGDTTQITGALIATIDEDGNDLGNLNLSTGDLNFTDLRDSNTSNQQSAGISTSINVGGTNATEAEQGQTLAKDSQGRPLQTGTTNITYSNTSHNEASKALATLGSGNITVGGVQLEQNGEVTEAGTAEGSALTGLNRDTASTTKDLWNVDRQEGNVDLTVDHRMLSEEGRAEIGKQFDEFDTNLQTVAQDVPSASSDNPVAAAIGEFLNTAGEWTRGIVPSEKNAGGVVAQAPVLFGGDDNKQGAIQVRPADDPHVLGNPYDYMAASELPFYQDLDPQGQAAFDGVVVSKNFVTITSETATYQNFTNGMLNTLPQALVNGMEQTGAQTVTVNYNPTHGFIGDLLESSVDKVFGNGFIESGAAQQTGEFINSVVELNANNGTGETNFVAHSQGNLLMNAGMNTLSDDDFTSIHNEQLQDVTVFSNGSPVQTNTMEETVHEYIGFTFSGSNANPDDAVAEGLGRNRGLYLPEQGVGSADSIGVVDSVLSGIKNMPSLGGDKYPELDAQSNQINELSPHSTYDCIVNCGDNPE
jgi:filamentous hemagglutinin